VELSYAQKRKCTLKVRTSNFRTHEGSRPSCVIEHEIHHPLHSKGGRDFHSVMARDRRKRHEAEVCARRLKRANGDKPAEASVARTSREGWEDGRAGRAVDTGRLLYDSSEVRSDVPLKPPEERWTGTTESGEPAATLDDRIEWLMELLSEVRGDA